jgi:formylglycine-generating enzyme required for sulfatase activity
VSGLDANVWKSASRTLVTLRNRTKQPLRYRVPEHGPDWVAFWGDRSDDEEVTVEADGTQAIAFDDPAAAERALAHFDRLSRRADVDVPGYDERSPRPRLVSVLATPAAKTAGMIELPGGTFDMTLRHERRECGCYPTGATDDAMWGWFHRDEIVHAVRVTLQPFAIRAKAVTNEEYVAFVRATSYRPADPARFLAHLRRENGAIVVPHDLATLPVTFVSLADARAFAAWEGQRLPTEDEWHHAAGAERRYPWGDEERAFPPALRPAFDEATATPEGVLGLSGNAWELTESEHTDGHTRFVMLRGGVFLPPRQSEWLPERGTRPNDSHAKYLLLADGLDRAATISFRTAFSLAGR